MILHRTQKIVAKDEHRFRVLNCGRRWGKTELAAEEMLGVAIAKKDRRVAYYAPTREDARDIMWSILTKKCAGAVTYQNETRLELKVKTRDGGESLITLYGWEAVQERGKGRGIANDFLVLDEVSSFRNFWEGWNNVLSPTLIDRKGSALFISTPKGYNHFYDLHELEKRDHNWKSFHFTTYDNPFIPVDEIERERKTKPEDSFAQEYLADFRKREGLVYKDFDRKKHLFSDEDEIHSIKNKWVAIDWGFTNPTAMYTIYEDYDSNFWITDEYYKRGQVTDDIIEVAQARQANGYYPDPAEPDRLEMMRRKKLNVKDVSKDVEAGISSVQTLLRQDRLHIHTSCLNLIDEFESYAFEERKEKAKDKNEPENPIKENDHGLDAIRYCLHMRTNIKLKTKMTVSRPDYTKSNYGERRTNQNRNKDNQGARFASQQVLPVDDGD